MSIKHRLIGFVIVGALFADAMGILAYWIKQEMVDAMDSSLVSMRALRNQMEAEMMHDAIRGEVLAAILAGSLNQTGKKHEVLEDLAKHVKAFREALAANDALSLNGEMRQALARVRPAMDAYIQAGEAVAVAGFDAPATAAAQLPRFMNSFRMLKKEMGLLSGLAYQNAEDAKRVAEDISRQSNKAILIGLWIAFAGMAALAFYIIKSITRPLAKAVHIAETVAKGDLTQLIEAQRNDETGHLLSALRNMNASLVTIVSEVRSGTDTIASVSSQIASGNLELSSRTEMQAGSLEETAATMEELTSTVRQNADNARQANSLAQSASAVAVRGGAVVSGVVDNMGTINESAKKIADIIGVIDGIAFQTNILALNAAVEAARAGEQGHGFAVVATEVRNLAHRSAAAAKEIKALIGDSLAKVETGSKLVSEAGHLMEEVLNSVKRVTDVMTEIAAASKEQSEGIEQVNQAIMQMDQATQQNAALVEEAAAAAASMQGKAAGLFQVVSTFKIDGLPAEVAVASRM